MRRLTNGLVAAVGLGLLGFLLLVSLPELVGGSGPHAGASRAAAPGVPADGSTAPDGRASEDGAAPRELRCPPCGMTMPADAEPVDLAGRRWALCSERCAELVAADPERFAADAVGAD